MAGYRLNLPRPFISPGRQAIPTKQDEIGDTGLATAARKGVLILMFLITAVATGTAAGIRGLPILTGVALIMTNLTKRASSIIRGIFRQEDEVAAQTIESG
jgi:hypothetical protein